MDIFPSESFVKSNNIFMLLLRLLYVENYKRSYVFKSYGYHKILACKIVVVGKLSLAKKEIDELSLFDLFEFLRLGINYYIKIYGNDLHFEYQLGKTILNQLD